ncbi:transposase, MuDR, MULE transposase domain protein [Tanacetum coccineum]
MMKSAKWVVCGVSDHQYQVYDGRYNRQVDFHTGTCQCHKWQLLGLPCGHVIALTKYLGLTDCFQFVSDWFKKPKYQGTYAEPIHFIMNVQEWEFPQHIRKAIPPSMDNPQPGRPENTNRIKSQDFSEMISHLTRKISRRFTTVYYTLPPNNTLSGLKQIKNDYDTNVMYDIAKVAGKIQLFVSHHQIDLSTVLIPNDGSLEEAFAAHYKLQIYIDHLGVDFFIAKYIFPNASLAEMMNHVITNYTSDSEDNKMEVTQNDYTFNQMVEWAEQEHFEDEETKLSCPKIDLSTSMADSASDARKTIVSNLQRELEAEATLANTMLGNLTRYSEQMRIREIQITMLQNMPTMSLNSYGLHALLMTHEADIRTTNNLIKARQELLRSIAEKQNFINNYRAI